jgi:hypothetical protein
MSAGTESRRLPVRGDQRWNLPWSQWETLLAGAGTVILVCSWPVFVFTGNQISYLVATAGACLAACGLAHARTPVTVGFLIGVLALVGTDVNGQLGEGNALLGSLRLFDLTVAAAAVVAVWHLVRSRPRAVRRPTGLALLSVIAFVYATARWAMEGHRVDSFLRTDLRLVAIAALTSFVAWRCRRGDLLVIPCSMVIVGVLAAAKALAIHASGIVAIGSYDRLQASSQYSLGQLRTILIGGDTLLILVPATAVLLASGARTSTARAALAVAALICIGGESVSGTRTSVLVEFSLAGLSLAAVFVLRRPRLTRRMALTAILVAAAAVGLAVAGGAPARISSGDAPNSGLAFRAQEVDSFLRLPAASKYLGQGLGGRFLGMAANGASVMTGWAHELPVWLALKDGVFGLLCAILAIVLIVRREIRALRSGSGQLQALIGASLIIGLLVMSLTIDRVALIEGVVMLVIGVFLVTSAIEPEVGA